MANINEELEKISSAIYGKDVRSAIHDSIKAINDEVTDEFKQTIAEQRDEALADMETKKDECLAEIPEDYTNLNNSVDELKGDLDDIYNVLHGTIENISLNGNVTAIGPSNHSWYYKCKPNTKYIIKRNLLLTHFVVATTTPRPTDINIPLNQKIVRNFEKEIEITTGDNDEYLIVWFYNVNDDASTPFESAKNDIRTFNSPIIEELNTINKKIAKISPTIITVDKNGTGDFTEIKKAIDFIGTKANTLNRYEIRVLSGTYNVYEELGGDSFYTNITSTSNNRLGLIIRDYVSLVGVGDVILEFLPDDSKATLANTTCVSPIEVYGNSTIENIRIKAKNCRYCIHDESGNSSTYANSEHVYKNVHLEHLGNHSGCWVSSASIASGTSSGCKYVYENCTFKSSNFYAFSIHNNSNQESNTITFDGCEFDGYFTGASVKISYYGDNAETNQSNVYVKNCNSTYKINVRPEGSSNVRNVWRVHNFTNIEVIVD